MKTAELAKFLKARIEEQKQVTQSHESRVTTMKTELAKWFESDPAASEDIHINPDAGFRVWGSGFRV